jgi:tetratricopeptide (TPR) repeat protein
MKVSRALVMQRIHPFSRGLRELFYHKAIVLASSRKTEKAIESLDQIIDRFRQTDESGLHAEVADAMVYKARLLRRDGHLEEAIQIYDEVRVRFAASTEPLIRKKVAEAMVAKGESLRFLDRNSDAIEAFGQVIDRFSGAADAGVSDELGQALLGKAKSMAYAGFSEETTDICKQITDRFASYTTPALRKVVREAADLAASLSPHASPAARRDLPELRDFIRTRRAALFGFMEQGAALKLSGDLLTVTPRNDIYVRYLNDNLNLIADLASELYGRRIRVELATK